MMSGASPAKPQPVLVALAKAVAPGIAARAAEAESLRRMPDDTVADLRHNGFIRMMVPRRFGGSEVDFTALADVVFEIAGVCAASGWIASLYASHAWLVGIFPAQAQEDVWGPNPDALISTLTGCLGKVTRVSGGFTLTGRWPQSSGVHHAEWAVLGATEVLPDGTKKEWECLLERSQFRILDTWFAVGVRGSGSNTVIVEEAFVPSHRTIERTALVEGTGPGGALPGAPPLYRLPMVAGFMSGLVSPIVGAAMGALESCRARLTPREDIGHGQQALAQSKLAEAAATIDCGALLLQRNMHEGMSVVARGHKLPLLQRARMRRDYAYIATLCNRALTELLGSCGGSVLQESSPTQRAWRDIRMMSAHIVLNFDAASELWGRMAVGLPATDTPF
jgi:3-hydroxy-9,10-secoandrosta-1,3,5(10)-triene-9,17-dione monooxygenase